MSGTMFIFGLGYCTSHLRRHLATAGWSVTGTRRAADDAALAFDDRRAVEAALAQARHVISSVPPDAGGDPVLAAYGDALRASPSVWIGYLSSTGVYGDCGGAWVDETAPIGTGRRKERAQADAAWLELDPTRVRSFRLPGIYGPGRSPLDRARDGNIQCVDVPGQIFSRVHVADIVAAIVASFERGGAGAFNIADDLPAPQAEVNAYACRLVGREPPAAIGLDDARLSPAARAFYAENRRVANGKAKRVLGWSPYYPDYRAGFQSLLQEGI